MAVVVATRAVRTSRGGVEVVEIAATAASFAAVSSFRAVADVVILDESASGVVESHRCLVRNDRDKMNVQLQKLLSFGNRCVAKRTATPRLDLCCCDNSGRRREDFAKFDAISNRDTTRWLDILITVGVELMSAFGCALYFEVSVFLTSCIRK